VKTGILSFIFLSILISISTYAQDKMIPHLTSPVDFFKEEITVTIDDSSSSVFGIYYFRNNTERGGKMPIMFPFYVDSASLFPETVFAYTVNGNDTTALDVQDARGQNAVMIEIPMKPNGITIWHLDYSQKILGPKATYILTSTGAWGKPLEDATYRFIIPNDYDSTQTWPEPDSTIIHDSHRELLAHRTNFMPKQNMMIEWKSK
jgi:hypothetical protein